MSRGRRKFNQPQVVSLHVLGYSRWRLQTASQWEMVANSVFSLVNVAAITFYSGRLHVEIQQDGRGIRRGLNGSVPRGLT